MVITAISAVWVEKKSGTTDPFFPKRYNKHNFFFWPNQTGKLYNRMQRLPVQHIPASCVPMGLEIHHIPASCATMGLDSK